MMSVEEVILRTEPATQVTTKKERLTARYVMQNTTYEFKAPKYHRRWLLPKMYITWSFANALFWSSYSLKNNLTM